MPKLAENSYEGFLHMKRFILAGLFTSSHFLLAYIVMPLMITHCGADAPYIHQTTEETVLTPAACKRQVNLTAECAKIISDDQSAFETEKARQEKEKADADAAAAAAANGAADPAETPPAETPPAEDPGTGAAEEDGAPDGSGEGDGALTEGDGEDTPPQGTNTRFFPPTSTDLRSRIQIDTNAIANMRRGFQDFVLQDQNVED